MTYEADSVKKAFAVFLALVERGEITPVDSELFSYYQEMEVRVVLEDVIEAEARVKILATGDALYLSPAVDNKVFGYSNEQLRTAMSLRNNQELYLAYFLILTLLALCYNSDDQSVRSREYLPVEELEAYITAQVQRIAAAEPDDVATMEIDLEINLQSVAQMWQELPAYDDKLKNLSMGRNNRVSFILRVMRFLEEQGLVLVLEQSEIQPTTKLNRMVTHYYYNNQRKERIINLLRQPMRLLPTT